MTGLYFAVVEGDPLDNGNGRVLTGSEYCFIDDDNGHARRQTHLGHLAYCGVCNSSGPIVAGAGIRQSLRGYDERLQAFEAVDGDIVVCKCERHPRIISLYGRSCMYWDEGDGAPFSGSPASSQETAPLTYDQQFTLTDATGRLLAGTYYTIESQGALIHGVTDALGRTKRYETDGAQTVRIYLGHRTDA